MLGKDLPGDGATMGLRLFQASGIGSRRHNMMARFIYGDCEC